MITENTELALNTVNPVDDGDAASSANSDASAEQRRLFGHIPMYRLVVDACTYG